ncbi:MAG: 6-bladed beta-propeller [Dysgonamonadaceae bacterium]|jgi:hypothetical protein|nr:6-bladed beta-propeller [Dysgonamonadaceae bacterium]
MMNKHFFLLPAVFFLLACGCSSRTDRPSSGKQIHFDYKEAVENFDIGTITDSVVQIIPLETTGNSLIAKIDKIEIKNNTIYIKDDLAKSVYVYDINGKYLNKIHAVGQGPGEYSNLSYMTVTDTSIVVLDHFMGKHIEYRLPDMKFMREERLFDKIWATEVFALPGTLYYYNGWSNSQSGKYHLFSRKTGEADYNKYMPFEKEPLSLGINGPEYAVNGNEASLIFSGDNMIYRINAGGEAYSEYEMVFKNEKVAYASGKVENVFRDNPPGRILNINAINESDRYLFIDVSVTTDGNKPIQPGNHGVYTCLYDKSSGQMTIYPQLAFNSKFDGEQTVVLRVIDNKIITWREANIIQFLNEAFYSKQTFVNKTYEKRLKEVVSNLRNDDNPVLFIYNLK